jgi:hypothetical protein
MGNPNEELNQVLAAGPVVDPASYGVLNSPDVAPAQPLPDFSQHILARLSQWTTDGGSRFVPASGTAKTLPPGYYGLSASQTLGLYFERIPLKLEGVLRFPHTSSDKVLSEIQTFWAKRDTFLRAGLTHKRGIMLWGPPGAGKSCTIQLVMADVIERGGIGLQFTVPGLFLAGMRILREIQPSTPVVVLMEDIDSIIQRHSESEVLNLLDGAELVDRCVFLASTNYPELLGARIINRPSRFDKRFKIGHPPEESRVIYLDHISKAAGQVVPVEQWARDTEGFSFAHLKELFVAVNILGDSYDEALGTLRSMQEKIQSGRENGQEAGFQSRDRAQRSRDAFAKELGVGMPVGGS